MIEETGQVDVVPCGAERAEDVHDLTQAAFAPYGIDPPSGALRETLDSVRAELAASGGAVATVDGRLAGSIRWDLSPDGEFHVGRLAVHPSFQRRGVGRALMEWAERKALRQGRSAVVLGVRIALPGNLVGLQSGEIEWAAGTSPTARREGGRKLSLLSSKQRSTAAG